MKRNAASRCPTTVNGRHEYGDEAWCLVCGAPAPRCPECGRKTWITGNGGTVRCGAGHTFRARVAS